MLAFGIDEIQCVGITAAATANGAEAELDTLGGQVLLLKNGLEFLGRPFGQCQCHENCSLTTTSCKNRNVCRGSLAGLSAVPSQPAAAVCGGTDVVSFLRFKS